LRTSVVYLALLVGLRLTGTRQLGQMSTFDLVLLLIIANAVQNAMVGPDTSLAGGLVAAGVLIGWHRVIDWWRLRSRRLARQTAEEPGAASLAVTVPVEQVREAEDRATSAYQRRARLPGFRKGKAPAAIVKKHFADDIRQEALQELIRASWKVAVEQESLKPVADPHIHNLRWDIGAPVTFEFHVEVKPDIKLGRLGGFQLKR